MPQEAERGNGIDTQAQPGPCIQQRDSRGHPALDTLDTGSRKTHGRGQAGGGLDPASGLHNFRTRRCGQRPRNQLHCAGGCGQGRNTEQSPQHLSQDSTLDAPPEGP